MGIMQHSRGRGGTEIYGNLAALVTSKVYQRKKYVRSGDKYYNYPFSLFLLVKTCIIFHSSIIKHAVSVCMAPMSDEDCYYMQTLMLV